MSAPALPVVLIHGAFGHGRQRPLWGSRWARPYWPERALAATRAACLIVDVGVLSSAHDRACEAFYQLYGGRVDYGAQHSADAGHDRYGELVPREQALHPDWSEDSPVHLLGHSFGSTTAIELYQLLCADFFGVGSNHRWVRSIVSIAGPLAGSTLPHAVGLHAAPPEGRTRALSLAHAFGSGLALWFRLHNASRLARGFYPFRMPQWEARADAPLRALLSPNGPISSSRDLAVYDLLPAERMARNARLRDMDKVFLLSVATGDLAELHCSRRAAVEASLTLGTAVATAAVVLTLAAPRTGAAAVGVALALAWRVCRRWMALLPSWWLLARCVHSLPAAACSGGDRGVWRANDGAVNVHSMLKPWRTSWTDTPTVDGGFKVLRRVASSLSTAASDDSDALSDWSSASSSSSPCSPRSALGLPTEDAGGYIDSECESAGDASELLHDDGTEDAACGEWPRGTWHVRRVAAHHLLGTSFDRRSPALMRSLLRVVAERFEKGDDQSSIAAAAS